MASGVIVAGGRSTRFGDRDKAVADLAGTPMLRRVADCLTGPVDALVVNCRPDQVPAVEDAMADYCLPWTVAEDPEPDRGPMAGIRTGLRAVDDDYAVVVACDMPFVDPAIVSYLVDRARGEAEPLADRGSTPSDAGDASLPADAQPADASPPYDAAVPRIDDEWFQTTHAVYRTEAMAQACDRALAAGERRIVEPLFDLDYVVVDEPELRAHGSLETFVNLNTREEFEAAAERLA